MAEAEAAEKQMERLRSERNEARTALETERKRHAEEVELLKDEVRFVHGRALHIPVHACTGQCVDVDVLGWTAW